MNVCDELVCTGSCGARVFGLAGTRPLPQAPAHPFCAAAGAGLNAENSQSLSAATFQPPLQKEQTICSDKEINHILVLSLLRGILRKRVSCARGRSIADPRHRRHRHPAEIFRSFCEEKLARCSTFEI